RRPVLRVQPGRLDAEVYTLEHQRCGSVAVVGPTLEAHVGGVLDAATNPREGAAVTRLADRLDAVDVDAVDGADRAGQATRPIPRRSQLAIAVLHVQAVTAVLGVAVVAPWVAGVVAATLPRVTDVHLHPQHVLETAVLARVAHAQPVVVAPLVAE